MTEITLRLVHAEHYALECYELFGFGNIALVDGWAQLSLTSCYIPSLQEQAQCLQDLYAWTEAGKRQETLQYWHFLRKPPALKVRWRVTSIQGLLPILTTLLEHPWAWLEQVEADSVFGQRELLQGYYPDLYAKLMDQACSAVVHASPANADSWQVWIKLVLVLMLHGVPDVWQAWEALSRFERMRTQNLTNVSQPLLYDPESFYQQVLKQLPQWTRPFDPDASGVLMLLNYLFNSWAVDASQQAQILAGARAQLCPELKGA